MLNWKSILMSSVITITFVIVGCSKTDAPVGPTQSTKPDIPAEVQSQLAQAEQFERLIQAMDPYVTQEASGAYVFDEAGFGAQYASLPNDDRTVVDQLTGGIAVVNQQLVDPEALAKVWFQRYWWGYKECYSELSAEYMLDGMMFTIYGLAIYPSAKYLYYHFGYFCIYHTWAGGAWANL